MIFDIVAIVFVLVFSLVMMKRGGTRAILSLGGLVLSMIVASFLYPVLTDAVYKTPLPENLEAIVRETIDVNDTYDAESIDALPEFIKNAIDTTATTVAEDVASAVAKSVTRTIISVVIFVLLVILTKLIIMFITGALNLVMKLPVLSELNMLVGFVCGLAISGIIVWLAVAFISSIGASNVAVAAWIEGSRVAEIMSNISPF